MEEIREQLTEDDFRRRTLKEAGITFSLSAVLPLLASVLASVLLAVIFITVGAEGYEDRDWYLYLNYLIPQLCFAAAAIVFFKRSKFSVKQTYRGCKWYYFPLALLLQFGLWFSLSGLNGYFIELLRLMGYHMQGMSLPSLSGWNLLPAILVIALLPALCEETIMRGILTKQMRRSGWGTAVNVLVSGALFSLFHHNPEQTLYQFVCGMCYALIDLRAGSFFPTMVAHFCNNAVILTLQSVYAPRFPDNPNWDIIDIMPREWFIALMVISAL